LLNRSAAGSSWLIAALRGVLHDAGMPHERIPRMARMLLAFLLGYATGEVTGGLPAASSAEDAAAESPDQEFEADLADLVRLIEVAVRVG
jgi:hypothetical protein